MHKKQFAVVMAVTLALILGLLAGCGGDNATKNSTANKSTTAKTYNLKISVGPITDMLPAFVADANGYFKQENLNVDLVTVAGGSQIASAVQGGSLDIGYSNITALISAHEQGLDFVLLGPGVSGPLNNSPEKLLVPADSAITSAKQLEGGSVAVNSLGSIDEMVVKAWLTKEGADPSKVHFVEIPFPDMVAALKAKRMTAAYVVEPFITASVSSGVAKILANSPMDVISQRPISGGWFARKPWVDSHSREAAAFARAIVKANQFIKENPQKARQIMIKYIKMNQDLATKIMLPDYNQKLSQTEIQTAIDFAAKYKLIKSSFPAGTIMDFKS